MTADTRFSRTLGTIGSGLLLLAVAAVFARSIGFDFVNYDDFVHVKENDLVCNFSLASLLRFWRAPYEGFICPSPIRYGDYSPASRPYSPASSLTPLPISFTR
ncbi:MAG: hypothetical protein HGA96_05045 [Desulfobulbaceae bacterium]|nr:hypothetical protein [Desulfobulbaceae bacterium]